MADKKNKPLDEFKDLNDKIGDYLKDSSKLSEIAEHHHNTTKRAQNLADTFKGTFISDSYKHIEKNIGGLVPMENRRDTVAKSDDHISKLEEAVYEAAKIELKGTTEGAAILKIIESNTKKYTPEKAKERVFKELGKLHIGEDGQMRKKSDFYALVKKIRKKKATFGEVYDAFNMEERAQARQVYHYLETNKKVATMVKKPDSLNYSIKCIDKVPWLDHDEKLHEADSASILSAGYHAQKNLVNTKKMAKGLNIIYNKEKHDAATNEYIANGNQGEGN